MSLPYGLKCSFLYDDEEIEGGIIVGMELTFNGDFFPENPLCFVDEFGEYRADIIKPILRPLSDLTKEITHKGEKFVPYIELLRLSSFDVDNMTNEELEHFKSAYSGFNLDLDIMAFSDALKLIEWHFAIGIDKSDYIDVNTLKTNPYEI